MKLTVLKNHVPIDEVLVDTPEASEKYEIFVGRAEDCHLRIDDPLMSRHHLVLTSEPDGWYCRKLSLLGVVTINGSIVTRTKFSAGDEIKCGIYSVIVTDLPGQHTSAPAAIPSRPPSPEDYPALDDVQLADDLAPVGLEPLEELDDHSLDLDSPMLDMEESAAEPETVDGGFDFDEESFSVTPSPAADENGQDDDFAAESENLASDFNGGEMAEFGSSELTEEETGTQFFKTFVKHQLILFGEHAPYDRFVIDQDEIFIGRDNKKCQIILDDPEVSTVHAVIRKSKADIILEDLNSSNGTILNGQRINKAQITTGDEFVIGSTSFTLEIRSDLLEAESDRLMPVQEGQVIETEEIEEEEVTLAGGDSDFAGEAPVEKSIIKRIMKDPALRIRALIGLIVLGGFLLWLDEDTPDANKPKTTQEKPAEKVEAATKLDPALEKRRNQAYQQGIDFFEQNKYYAAEEEFNVVISIDPKYKQVETYLEQTRVGLKRLQELEAQKRADEERLKLRKEVEELLVKAREAVKERSVSLAQDLFSRIVAKDPENIEVQQLKLELEAWQSEQEKIALEKAARDAARKAMVDAFMPGKTLYLKKEWYQAIGKLEVFLRLKGIDEDLVKEASEMISDAKIQLLSELGPLLGQARSFKEGQDFRNAYEAFLEILKIDPTHAEALNEVDDIRGQLENRSKRIYREAIIAESLSLFSDAKEKFQEVQQISPTDSDYYRKANDKLRNYLE